ncbi:MAG TPA: hypothetical protein VGT08_16800 [Terracidiphilus sp.]|nr:hypothetical protein [Terracidiphilus sp.]
MNWDRKGVLLMLAVVVFWAAAPASSCLLGTRHSSQPDCCRATPKDCGTPAMGADSSCCQIHGKTPAVAPVQPYSPVRSHEVAYVPHQAGIGSMAAPGAGYQNALETPPPKFPPGGAFSLRI